MFITWLSVCVLLSHAFTTLGVKRGLLFILLSCLVGFTSEFIGLRYGAFFGGRYIYHPHISVLFTVPISVIAYWAVFIYTGYSITNSFLYWLNKKKPSILRGDFISLFFLVCLDGVLVTFIDLFIDPIAVHKGNWTWLDKGPYFGIPIGNFIGWFIVTVIVTGTFRIFEYFRPNKIFKVGKVIYLLPTIGYGLIWFSYLITAFTLKMESIALIGTILMLSVVICNIIAFSNHISKIIVSKKLNPRFTKALKNARENLAQPL